MKTLQDERPENLGRPIRECGPAKRCEALEEGFGRERPQAKMSPEAERAWLKICPIMAIMQTKTSELRKAAPGFENSA
jgi:hypothetical protein